MNKQEYAAYEKDDKTMSEVASSMHKCELEIIAGGPVYEFVPGGEIDDPF